MSIPTQKPHIIAIVGPTASGKTSLSLEIAKQFGGEIISADSRQVYRGMDIGTGKATRREQRMVPHHLLDVASPRNIFTVVDYQNGGRTAIKKILAKKKIPIIVGGTGFYIDALLYNYDLPSVKPNLKLRRKLEARSAAELFRELKRLDPRRARTIERYNKRRLVRALEIIKMTGKPVPTREATLQKKTEYRVLKIGLIPLPATLNKNIHLRLLGRLRQGMVAEVRRLHDRDHVSWKRLDDFGLEYRYVSRYLRGLVTHDEMVRETEKEISRYAKRQMTWFKRDPEIHWIKSPATAEKIVKGFLRINASSVRKGL